MAYEEDDLQLEQEEEEMQELEINGGHIRPSVSMGEEDEGYESEIFDEDEEEDENYELGED